MTDKHEIEGQLREVEFVDLHKASEPSGSERVRVGVQLMDAQSMWLRIGNRQQRVVVAKGEGGTWVWHAGRARFLETTRGDPRRKPRKMPVPGAITPPTPATVVRIMVEVGDEVEQGQGLVVVSAMKMEATLSSPYKGVVQTIHAEVGATVRPGEILVDVQALDAPAPETKDAS